MTLAELVPCYMALPVPFTKPRAVHVIVYCHLRAEGFWRRSRRGKGNRAARRIAALAESSGTFSSSSNFL